MAGFTPPSRTNSRSQLRVFLSRFTSISGGSARSLLHGFIRRSRVIPILLKEPALQIHAGPASCATMVLNCLLRRVFPVARDPRPHGQQSATFQSGIQITEYGAPDAAFQVRDLAAITGYVFAVWMDKDANVPPTDGCGFQRHHDLIEAPLLQAADVSGKDVGSVPRNQRPAYLLQRFPKEGPNGFVVSRDFIIAVERI